MNNFWRRAKPFVWGALCIILALYFSPLSAQINYTIATHDISPFWIRLFPNGAFLFILPGSIIGIVAPCFVLISLGSVRFQGAELKPIVGYVALMWLFSWLSFAPLFLGAKVPRAWPLRRTGLQQAATRARPLIGAIEKFKLENKRLPANLQELVPNYLTRIPGTHMAAYQQFRYETRDERDERGKKTLFRSYQLQVATPKRFFNWDTFIYWPEGNYPDSMYGGCVERVGAWAYVHEEASHCLP